MALRGRGLAAVGSVGAVGAAYYLYTAGGNPKVAEKNLESTCNTLSVTHPYDHLCL